MPFVWDWRQNGSMIKPEAKLLARWWNKHHASYHYEVQRDPRYAKRKRMYCVHQIKGKEY